LHGSARRGGGDKRQRLSPKTSGGRRRKRTKTTNTLSSRRRSAATLFFLLSRGSGSGGGDGRAEKIHRPEDLVGGVGGAGAAARLTDLSGPGTGVPFPIGLVLLGRGLFLEIKRPTEFAGDGRSGLIVATGDPAAMATNFIATPRSGSRSGLGSGGRSGRGRSGGGTTSRNRSGLPMDGSGFLQGVVRTTRQHAKMDREGFPGIAGNLLHEGFGKAGHRAGFGTGEIKPPDFSGSEFELHNKGAPRRIGSRTPGSEGTTKLIEIGRGHEGFIHLGKERLDRGEIGRTETTGPGRSSTRKTGHCGTNRGVEIGDGGGTSNGDSAENGIFPGAVRTHGTIKLGKIASGGSTRARSLGRSPAARGALKWQPKLPSQPSTSRTPSIDSIDV
jgi:hypothetical protein